MPTGVFQRTSSQNEHMRRRTRFPATEGFIQKISDVCAAWLGAMLDAEGSTLFRDFSGGKRRQPVIQISNTDPEILSTIMRIAQVGSVTSDLPRSNELGRKMVLKWALQRWWDTLHLARRLSPYSTKAARLVAQMEDSS